MSDVLMCNVMFRLLLQSTGVNSQVCPNVCSLIIKKKVKVKERNAPVKLFFYLFFIFLHHPFFPHLSDPPVSAVVSHFHVGAERHSPPLSAVISLLRLNRQVKCCSSCVLSPPIPITYPFFFLSFASAFTLIGFLKWSCTLTRFYL